MLLCELFPKDTKLTLKKFLVEIDAKNVFLEEVINTEVFRFWLSYFYIVVMEFIRVSTD